MRRKLIHFSLALALCAMALTGLTGARAEAAQHCFQSCIPTNCCPGCTCCTTCCETKDGLQCGIVNCPRICT